MAIVGSIDHKKVATVIIKHIFRLRSAMNPGLDQHVYELLKRSSQEIGVPGKDTMRINLVNYARSHGVNIDLLRLSIQTLSDNRRIFASRMNTGPVEIWRIRFVQEIVK